MSEIVQNVRALLRQFEASGRSDLHVRVGSFEMFVARSTGAANPLLARLPASVPAIEPASLTTDTDRDAVSEIILQAPHICSVVSVLPVGSDVGRGDVVARLALLDETIDLQAPQTGYIGEILIPAGQMAEYASPIVTIVAAGG